MKRLLTSLFIAAIALTFIGCGGSKFDTTSTAFGPQKASLWRIQDGGVTTVGNKSVKIRQPVLSVAANTTLTARQMKGYRIYLTGDGTVLTLADSDECDAGDCILVRVADATAKSVDASSDDADNFELNGVDMTASYAIDIAASNQGKELLICLDVAASNEWIAKGDLEWTDSGGD
jgi:hypothetical protein